MFTVRLIVAFLFLFEGLAVFQVIPLKDNFFSFFYWIYKVIAYLLFFEVFWIFIKKFHRDSDFVAKARITAGFFFILSSIIDMIGGGANLFATEWYDKLLHFTTFAWLSVAWAIYFTPVFFPSIYKEKSLFHYCIFTGAIMIQVVHEIFELLVDLASKSNAGTAATSIHDTAIDLLSGFLGALVFVVIYSKIRKTLVKGS